MAGLGRSLLQSAQASSTDMISTVSGDAVCTNTISTVSGDAVCTDTISTVSSDTVCTNAISTISGDAVDVGVRRAILGDDGCIQEVAGVHNGQGESTGGKNREGQAKDQFVGFHEGCSSTFNEWVTRYGGDVTRRRINQKSIRLVANIVGIDSWQRADWRRSARGLRPLQPLETINENLERIATDSITPFVANSPVMSFFYNHPHEYKEHLTHEGQLDPAKREWQVSNNTYAFSDGLGSVEILIGLLVLSYAFSKRLGMVGSVLAFLTPIVTLSFLITTPEAWVSSLGDANFGFPFLSGGGRLVLKDVLMLAGGVVMIADSARQLLNARSAARGASQRPTVYTPRNVAAEQGVFYQDRTLGHGISSEIYHARQFQGLFRAVGGFLPFARRGRFYRDGVFSSSGHPAQLLLRAQRLCPGPFLRPEAAIQLQAFRHLPRVSPVPAAPGDAAGLYPVRTGALGRVQERLHPE
nr:hypothetical protein [Tanacetum cinerariifolium]